MAAVTTTVLTSHHATPNAMATSAAARQELMTASLRVSFSRAVERAKRGACEVVTAEIFRAQSATGP